MLQRFLLVFLFLFLVGGCVPSKMMQLNAKQLEQVNAVYDPSRECAFCLSSEGITNFQMGDWMSTPFPVCKRTEVMVHTHPWYAEKDVGYLTWDWYAWGVYKERYGNDLFGLMIGPGEIKLYER